jgi:hypothetical protein
MKQGTKKRKKSRELKVDITAPEVEFSSPSGTMVSVVPCEIEVRFSEAMNRESVENAFELVPGGLEGSFEWRNDTWLTWKGEQGYFEQSTLYTVTIGTGAKDKAGNRLESEYSWRFRTKDTLVINGEETWSWGEKVITGDILINGTLILQNYTIRFKPKEERIEGCKIIVKGTLRASI